MFDRVLVINYNSYKDCFLHFPSNYLQTGACVQLTYGDNQISYFSISASESKIVKDVYISSVYGRLLGIEENQPVTVTEITHLATVTKLTVAPINSTDYEILELLSENVQATLLDQIRVVYSGQKFIIWVGSNISIAVYVENVEPNSPGIIDFLTEVVIKPKSDDAEKKSLIPKTEVNENNSSVFNIDKLKSLKNVLCDKINAKQTVKFKEDMICRLVPLSKILLPCGIKENYKDFNVFISKQSLPKMWTSKNFPIISSMNLLTIDSFEKEIFVKLCILEDSVDLSPLSDLSLIDTVFVSNTVFKQFNSKIGCRIILRLIEEKPVVNEINIITKKTHLLNIKNKFKSYLAKDRDEIFVLNQDIPIDVGDHIKCSLKFSPAEAKFCVVDNDLIRNCKLLVTEGPSMPEGNNDENKSNRSMFVENISNYISIINDTLSIYSGQENHWENILITGRPGTGKSTLLKLIADKINSYPTFVFTKIINCKAIKGKTVDSLLKVFFSAFSELILYQPSVLLLDDLHLLCENVKGDDVAPNALYSHRVSEMMHTYLSIFSQFNKIGICATTESTSKLHKNIYTSRGSHLFKNLFFINDVSKADRILLLKYFFDKYHLLNVDFEYISMKTEGYVVQDMIDFCKKSIFEAYKSGCDAEVVTVNEDHFEKALKNTCVLSLQNVHLHSPGSKNFSDIGGLHEVKKILVESLMWPAQFPNIFANAPLRLQSGLLLYGAPGTGKTLLAAAAAKQCGLRLISIKGPELLSKYIGASEQAVRDVFQNAQSARPCILFFDEFDSLAPRRGHDNTGVTDRVVNQLLTQLDGVESLSGVCVLAATSRPDLLDPALLRPGRLDRQILCPLPSKDDRLEILTVLSKNVDFSEDVNLEVVASATEGYSGADLQSILYTAQLSTIDNLLGDSKDSVGISNSEITQAHLKDALKKTRPSLPEQERWRYEKIYTKFQGGTTVDEFIAGSKATLA